MQKFLVSSLLCMALSLTPDAFADNFVDVTARPTGVDTIDWGQLGATRTQIPSPADWTSTMGATGTVSDLGTLYRTDEGNGWMGIFKIGDHLLLNEDNHQPIDVHFNTPISLGGAKIQTEMVGPYLGCVQALGSFGASPVFCASGNNLDPWEMDTAPFIGVQDLSGANITDLLFTVEGANFPAINTLSFSGGQPGDQPAVPEPASMMLLGSGFLTAAGIARRRLRKL